jgi:hypothetical protein
MVSLTLTSHRGGPGSSAVSFQQHYGPGDSSASTRNEYEESSSVGGGRPARKADLTAICEPIV